MENVSIYTPFFRPSLCISSLEHAVSDYGDDEARLFMSGFFQELQRRKVYRVAAAYIIAAGFIIQIGSAVFPAWELPNWTFRLVVVLLLMGFPIALILGWLTTSLRKVSAQRQRPPRQVRTVAAI